MNLSTKKSLSRHESMAAPAAEPPRRLKAVEDYETSNGVKITIVRILVAHPLD